MQTKCTDSKVKEWFDKNWKKVVIGSVIGFLFITIIVAIVLAVLLTSKGKIIKQYFYEGFHTRTRFNAKKWCCFFFLGADLGYTNTRLGFN